MKESHLIVNGDVMDGLRSLADASFQCVVTSPPYWGLRDYGQKGQLGLEPTPEAYVSQLVDVFREIRRVLREDGTVWLNLGDSYTGSGKGGNPDEGKQATNRGSQTIGTLYGKTGETARRAAVTNVGRRVCAEHGMKAKDLVGIPWRVAFALQADGWWLRSDIIWAKPNPMPESVTDRPTKAHEHLFLLTKAARYYYDADSIREPLIRSWDPRTNGGSWAHTERQPQGTKAGHHSGDYPKPDPRGANRRSVWTIATEPFPEAHFAVMPTALVEPCVKAGSRAGDTVLDPFCGSGTVGVVARRLGRSFVGIDLSPEYCEMARRRIENYHRERPPEVLKELPLFDEPIATFPQRSA